MEKRNSPCAPGHAAFGYVRNHLVIACDKAVFDTFDPGSRADCFWALVLQGADCHPKIVEKPDPRSGAIRQQRIRPSVTPLAAEAGSEPERFVADIAAARAVGRC